MKNEQLKSEWPTIFYALIGIVIGLLIMNKCGYIGKPEPTPSNNTALENHNITITRRIAPRKHRTDSASAIIPKAQKAAQVYFDTVIVYMPDTCKPYLLSYKLFRDSTENILLYVVASQDSTIKDQDTIIQNQAKMLENDKVAIRDTVKYFDRKVRRVKWKWLGFGILIGGGASGVINNLKD